MSRFAMLGRGPTVESAVPNGFQALADLRATWLRVLGTDPAYAASSALVDAWSDSTLTYRHQLSCEDPMTGLVNLVHVRGRITELYLQSDAVAAQAVRTVLVQDETVGLPGNERTAELLLDELAR